MHNYKKGDKVLYNDMVCKYVEYDDILDEHTVILPNGEELGVEDTLLEAYVEKSKRQQIQEQEEEEIEEDLDEDFDEDDFEDDEEDFDEIEYEADEDDDDIQETAAADTIVAKPSAAQDPSKAQMISNTISAMSGMGKSDMVDFFNKMMAQIGQEANAIDNSASDKNKKSIEAKTVTKEEIEELFGSEDLTEEFKQKTATLFEAAVNMRVTEKVAQIEEELEKRFDEEVEEISAALVEKVDEYLSYVADEWVNENELAIESSLNAQLAESFIHGLRDLFAEHYVSVPEDKADILENLAEKVEELEDKLNEQVNLNIELLETLEDYNKTEIFDEVSEGLTVTQVDKFRSLTESIDFDGDEDDYKERLETIKNHHFKTKVKETALHEEVDIEDENDSENTEFVDPYIANYAKAISRSVKR